MAKDPALLWYFNDWMGGTATLSRHLKGCYMDLLSVQFNSGPLSLKEIKTVLGSDFGSSWPTLQKKFKFENDCYFNERLSLEREKRSKFTESRRANAKHMPKHMEDINENRNINSILTPREETEKFMEMINQNSAEYLHFLVEFSKRTNLDENVAGREVKKFANYWCEKTGNGKKMRWEMEKTFEFQRRLSKWFGNASQWSLEKKLSKTRTIA